MNLLLDTHAFLWFIIGSPQLSGTARALIEDVTNEKFLSLCSLWEMAIKVSLGKLALAVPFNLLIPNQLIINGIKPLYIGIEHTTVIASLPFHHRDPFDRLLIAQAMTEKMPIISIDAAFDDYPVTRVW
jgi:PIN domain nuclease of toxin-antitoxin system